jgi:hypothetical protein
MGDFYSKQALIFADGNIRSLAGDVFRKHGFIVGAGIVDTPDALRRSLMDGVLVSYLRAQIISLIERKGYPYCFTVELPFKHPLQVQKDPDGCTLARSLLLSLLVIGMEQKYSEGRANLLVVSNEAERIRAIDSAPESILSIVDPQNEQIRLRLDNFMKDRILFSRKFLVKAVSSEIFVRDPSLMISGFLSQITARTNLEKKITPLSSPAVSMKNEASAKVLFFIDGEKCWIDGEIVRIPDDMVDLRKDAIHVIGAVHTKNLKEVTNRIRMLVTGGAGEHKFPAANEIVIMMGSGCTIDATAAMGFAQLLNSELSKYKKKKVIVSRVNDAVLRKSPGFMMIREYVRVDAY